MGIATEGEPIEIATYDGMVMVSGFGCPPVLLSAEAADRLAYKLSTAAFAAWCKETAVLKDSLASTEWRSAPSALRKSDPIVERAVSPPARRAPEERSFGRR